MDNFKALLALFLFCSQVSANTFEKKYQNFIQNQLPNASVGFIIQDPKDGKVIFESRAEENFYPASNTKLFTAAAALKFLGPNFQFQTSLHTSLNKIKDKRLEDNLYVVFRGDPTLRVEDLTTLFKELRAKGIRQITGNIVIDDQAFAGPSYAPGWTWDSIPWYYSAPITTIILNENKVRFKINKPTELYRKIHFEQVDEALPKFKLSTQVIAVSLPESENSCQLNVAIHNNQIQMGGCWPIEKTPTIIELALDEPKNLAKSLIQQALQKNNLKLTGKIQFAKAPSNIPAILIKHSPPLKRLLTKVLAESNNIYTESLTKALGLAHSGQGTFQAGIHAIKEILTKETRQEFSQIQLSDGSGQSRYNLISPYLISQLLFYMYHDPQFEIFQAGLPIGGQSGTLEFRFKNKPTAGKVIAKTGSATGTSALGGYLTTTKGKDYIFSLLINHATQDNASIKNFEDKLLVWLMEEPWSTYSTPTNEYEKT